MVKISFILHGKIRGKQSLLTEIDQIFNLNYEVAYYETRKAYHAEELTLQALQDGCEYLIAIGGDGTLNEVVNGFLHAGGRSKFSTVFGVLPWGTGNDFVRSIGVDKSVAQLLQLIENKSVKYIDAGKILLDNPGEKGSLRYFDNIADLGIGADVVALINGVHRRKKILGGTLIFFFTALKVFMTYRHKKVRVSWEGFNWEGPLLSLVVANGNFFGSGLGVAPDASLHDGVFQVVILGDVSVWDYLKNYGRLRRSERIILPDMHYLVSDRVRVDTEISGINAEADGEIIGQAPLEFRCLKAALPFLVADS
ncbi:MAG: diacylglycerol kinase family protein [Bacteroidota bacterium]|nr:diacylglycerol kinase family protein [Bacteroidota bacterium]